MKVLILAMVQLLSSLVICPFALTSVVLDVNQAHDDLWKILTICNNL